jgi:hypothetical protein
MMLQLIKRYPSLNSKEHCRTSLPGIDVHDWNFGQTYASPWWSTKQDPEYANSAIISNGSPAHQLCNRGPSSNICSIRAFFIVHTLVLSLGPCFFFRIVKCKLLTPLQRRLCDYATQSEVGKASQKTRDDPVDMHPLPQTSDLFRHVTLAYPHFLQITSGCSVQASNPLSIRTRSEGYTR